MIKAALLILLFTIAFSPSQRAAPQKFFGIMSQENPTLQDTRLMSSGGIGAYRIPMSWDSVQPSLGQPFNWTWVDQTIKNTSLANIDVLPIMMGTPQGFADDFRLLPIYTDEQKEGWSNYLKEAIYRYGPGGTFWGENPTLPYRPITTWQIWNEANFVWFASPVSPSAYSALLKSSFRTIKAADPTAKIMLSSLFARPIKGQGIDSTIFLRDLYRLGSRNYFHSAALHPYSKNTKEMSDMVQRLRKTMMVGGDKDKPLHLTEIGWGSGKATAFDKGSPTAQAKELKKAYRYLIKNRKRLKIASAYWFSWKDLPREVESCDFCYSSGLFYSGSALRAKPAWRAFKDITGRNN